MDLLQGFIIAATERERNLSSFVMDIRWVRYKVHSLKNVIWKWKSRERFEVFSEVKISLLIRFACIFLLGFA